MTADDILQKLADLERKIEQIQRIGFESAPPPAPTITTPAVIGETPAGTLNGTNVTFTLVQVPITGSLTLYQNGIRLKAGDDYSLSGQTITFTVAPLAGDILQANYFTGVPTFTDGSTSFIFNEVVNEVPNSVLTVFTLDRVPIAGTEMVFVDGQLKLAGVGNDYTLSGSTLTFAAAPLTGSNIQVTYQTVLTTSGNADTVDGYHASLSPTAGTIPVLTSATKLPAVTIPAGYKLFTLTPNITLTTTGVNIGTIPIPQNGTYRIRVVVGITNQSNDVEERLCQIDVKNGSTTLKFGCTFIKNVIGSFPEFTQVVVEVPPTAFTTADTINVIGSTSANSVFKTINDANAHLAYIEKCEYLNAL